MTEMKRYRIIKGQKHYMLTKRELGKPHTSTDNMTLYTEGQIVKLTEAAAFAIRDKIIPIEETADELQQKADKSQIKPEFEITHRGGGKYAVMNTITNLAVSEELLSKDEAKKMADELNESDD